MITGFNTDIEFQGTTYHVQTEDKGLATPLILSLVYHRGTILASKRSPYDDLVANFDEKVLAERLQKQHKLICAAIRAGRIEDLKRMTMKESAAKQNGLIAQKEIVQPKETKPSAAPPPEVKQPQIPQEIRPETKPAKNGGAKPEIPVPQFLNEKPPVEQPQTAQIPFDLDKILAEEKAEMVAEKVEPVVPIRKPVPIWDVPVKILEPIIEDVQIVEEEMILPDEAVQILTEGIGAEQVVDGNLNIELLGNETFRSGEKKTIGILVHRGNTKKGLSGTHIMVKILGSAFRPLIFHAKTDSNGIATVHLQMPQFKSGRAVVLIRAMSGNEETELRRAILHG
ncbi:MAG TPA: hypothetical protein VK892_09235 [Pyrinomonadaceae bacterium]|nr:hypothetical protein [Pyrinomonadaceae bacterium]